MTSCFRLNYPDGVTVIYSLRMAVHAVASPIQGLSSFLENYWCRNQVFRTVQFASGMLSGLLETSYPDVAGKLMIVSGSISEMRVMLRLLDDLPALAYNLQNWKPKKDTGTITRALDILSSISGQLYYPIEHIAWAADSRLVSVNSTRLWTWCICLWGISLLVGLLQAVRTLLRTSRELSELRRSRDSEPSSKGDPGQGGSSSAETSNPIPVPKKRVTFQDQSGAGRASPSTLRKERFLSLLAIVKNVSDLMNAVNWMPEGFLWAKRLSTFWVGLFGTVSSLVGLYKLSG